MLENAVKKAKRPSSWSQLPADEDDPSLEVSPAPSSVDRAASLLGASAKQAGRLSDRVNQGLRRASAAFMAPPTGELESLFSGTDLPAIDPADPLGSLGRRLDTEADLWRALALRALARAGWADRFTQAMAVISAVGCVALATVAALGALFSSGSAGPRSLLVLTGCGVLVAGGVLVAAAASSVRKAQHLVARDATRRADLIELRLHRLSAVLATRELGPEPFARALERLEQDTAAPTGG